MNLCRHCFERRANRCRGLCWTCYYTPGVLEHYPPVSPAGVHYQDFFGGHALPAEPTLARQGTAEKVAVLTERATARVSLWHPHDGKKNTLPC